MAETFQVGDTVRTNVAGVSVGTIAFGPFKATQDGPKRYMVQAQDGTAHSLQAADIRPYAIYTVGEEAEEGATGTTVTVEAGPFAGLGGADCYVIKRRNGVHSWVKSTMLRKRPTASEPLADWEREILEGSRRVVYAGRTYSLDAEYADRQGDVWKFNGQTNAAGIPLLDCPLHPTLNDSPLTYVLTHYGPLSRA